MSTEDFDYESPAFLALDEPDSEPEPDPEPEQTVRLRRVQSTAGVVKDLDTGESYPPREFFDVPAAVSDRLLAIRHRGAPVFVPAAD